MQITLVVPFVAMILWKYPTFGLFLCFCLIGANCVINFAISNHYGLSIGLLYHSNYFLLQGIISKPWTKTANIGFGALLAYIYMQILDYRTKKTDEEKEKSYPKIHKIYKSAKIGWMLILFGLACIFGNLLSTSANNADPSMSTPF